MGKKKDLAKIALAALIIASATPIDGQAEMTASGTFLAAGCAAHGCADQDEGDSSPSNQSNDSKNRPGFGQTTYESSKVAATDLNPSATMTEAQLLESLNAQGKAIYLSLDPQGKALAMQLAGQDSYRDKNLAVKEAQRRMSERNHSQKR